MDAVKAWLSSQSRWLLIIDNADDQDLDIANYVPTGSRGSVLITTRNPNLRELATSGSCKVHALDESDAVSLLLKSIASEPSSGTQVRNTAREVVNILGCLALAITQAGAVIRQQICSLESFCDLYTDRKRDLLESGRSKPSSQYQHSVYTTW